MPERSAYVVPEEVITRTPLRLPLGGGGSDAPRYSSQYGGFFVAGTFDKYVTITARPAAETTWTHNGDVGDVAYVRATLKELEWQGGAEVESSCEIASGSGLGGSGAFLVGLVHALMELRNEETPPQILAETAFRIESHRLGRPIGRQDHYAAAFGGVRAYEVLRHGHTIESDLLSVHLQFELSRRLLLFATNQTRDASTVLASQQSDATAADVLHTIKQIGRETWLILGMNQVAYYGELLRDHWAAKVRLASVTNKQIDEALDVGLIAGARACKVMGAGGGGYLQFYCEPERQVNLRTAMQARGLPELPFEFTNEGSCVLEHRVLTGSG